MKKESSVQQRVDLLTSMYPDRVIRALKEVCSELDAKAWFVGGTVRDVLLGKEPGDLDLTVNCSAHLFCNKLMARLGKCAFVPLGTEEEEGARVVWQGLDIDVSSFRGKSGTLEGDLSLRDFTINSLAVALPETGENQEFLQLIDPLSGEADIKDGIIRHCSHAFENDPLRLLRVYRFTATLGFTVAPETRQAVKDCADRIRRVAAERISHELDLILASNNAAEMFWQMHLDGVLQHLLPELYEGMSIDQPGFHHLDVFHHNFQALREIETILKDPAAVYPDMSGIIENSVSEDERRYLKWAALLHDIGKPRAKGESVKEAGRVTFYGHDEIGRDMVDSLALRLKWSNDERQGIGQLVSMHMHPFHLCTVAKETKLSRRAALKLCSRAGKRLEGLFLLAMADSLAGKGELKPESMERELVDLYSEVHEVYEQRIKPVFENPPLLNGKDLIDVFNLEPGPVFSEILGELQALQVEGEVKDREQALDWVGRFLKS